MGGLIAVLFSLPFVVLCAVLVGVGALIRAVFGGGRRRGTPWFVPLLLVVALFLAFEGARLLTPMLVPLVLIGLGVLLLRGARQRPTVSVRTVSAGRAPLTPEARPHAAPFQGPLIPATPSLESRLKRLPTPVREQAARLYEDARQALAALDDGTPAHDAYTIRATLDDYLPESVNAFLDIPEPRRTVPLPAGQTPLALFQGQLHLMREGLDRAVSGHSLARAERLVSHGRFLQERFGKDDDFKL